MRQATRDVIRLPQAYHLVGMNKQRSQSTAGKGTMMRLMEDVFCRCWHVKGEAKQS